MPKENLIEQITYTASLATHPEEIDPYLDKMRAITSQVAFSVNDLTERDREALLSVQAQLEDYLVTRESVRLFTRDSLRTQIQQHLDGDNKRRGMLPLLVTVGLTVAAVLLIVAATSYSYRFVIAGAAGVALLNLGSAWLFVSSLPAFTSALRRPFMFICAGVVSLGMGLAQLPFMTIFDLAGTTYGILVSPVPYIVAVVTMSWGIYGYAKLVGVQSRLLSLRYFVVAAVLLPLTLWLPFYNNPQFKEGSAILSVLAPTMQAITVSWLLIFGTMAIFVLPKISRKLTDLYRPPVRALRLAIFGLVLMLAYAALAATTGQELKTGVTGVVLSVILISMGSLFVRAGYIFKKISRY